MVADGTKECSASKMLRYNISADLYYYVSCSVFAFYRAFTLLQYCKEHHFYVQHHYSLGTGLFFIYVICRIKYGNTVVTYFFSSKGILTSPSGIDYFLNIQKLDPVCYNKPSNFSFS